MTVTDAAESGPRLDADEVRGDIGRTLERVGAWAGPGFLVLVLIALLLAHFLPPLAPSASATEIQAHYREHRDGIRLGMVILGSAFTLMMLWGAAIAIQTRRLEPARPFLSWIQVACMGACGAAGVLDALVWVLAAFRPEDSSAEMVRTISDFGWLIFVSYWQPFALWVVAIGVSILRGDGRVFPRWLGYLSVWAGVLFVPASLIYFFKTGPFAYNGAFAFWLPVTVFFVWATAMCWGLLRAQRR